MKIMDQDTISRYRILDKLGEGVMGVVFKAQDTKLDRLVALKILRHYIVPNPYEEARFLSEAKSISRLLHPNIAVLYDIEEVEGTRFLVLEYVGGGTLAGRIRNKRLETKEIISIAIQIAEGLSYAHRQGIIHQDVNTNNIMFAESGEVKITDFGLAQLRANKQQVAATPVSQEPVRVLPISRSQTQDDHSRIDRTFDKEEADVHAFGLALYEMMTGGLKFKNAVSSGLNLDSVTYDELGSVFEYRSDIPRGMVSVTRKALVKDPEEKYPCMDAMLDDLKAVKHDFEEKQRRYVREREGKSIAVLPLSGLDVDKENEWFSYGLAEDLIVHLSRIGGLRVIPPSATMRYKNTSSSIGEIGRELRVKSVLKGSVIRSGGQIRISVELISVEDESSLWAEVYDREAKDVLEVQSEVAQSIAKALEIQLTSIERKEIVRRLTKDPTAYDYYLKGRQYYYKYREQDNEYAMVLFQKAIELDGNFGEAYAALAQTFAQQHGRFGKSRYWIDKSVDMSRKLISMHPELSEAYISLGMAYDYGGRINQACKIFQTAVDLDPTNLNAITALGSEYHLLGMLADAVEMFEKAIRLDPTFAPAYAKIGETYISIGEYHSAEQWIRRALEFQPDFAFAYLSMGWLNLIQKKLGEAFIEFQMAANLEPNAPKVSHGLGHIHLQMKRYAEAKLEFEKCIAADSSQSSGYMGLAFALIKLGKFADALGVVEQGLNKASKLIDGSVEHYGVRYDMACGNALQGMKSTAIRWLEKAIEVGFRDYHVLQMDPLLEDIRGDDLFDNLIQILGNKIASDKKKLSERH
jgi:serine/threonine protein kinase/Tfp pilus assembly protein PilF